MTTAVCPQCRASLRHGVRFCTGCGYRLPPAPHVPPVPPVREASSSGPRPEAAARQAAAGAVRDAAAEALARLANAPGVALGARARVVVSFNAEPVASARALAAPGGDELGLGQIARALDIDIPRVRASVDTLVRFATDAKSWLTGLPGRGVRALLLDPSVYREIARDSGLHHECWVLLLALAIVGSFGWGLVSLVWFERLRLIWAQSNWMSQLGVVFGIVRDLTWQPITVIISVLVATAVTWKALARLGLEIDLDKVFRTLAFAHVALFFSSLPVAGWLAEVWCLAASVLAVMAAGECSPQLAVRAAAAGRIGAWSLPIVYFIVGWLLRTTRSW